MPNRRSAIAGARGAQHQGGGKQNQTALVAHKNNEACPTASRPRDGRPQDRAAGPLTLGGIRFLHLLSAVSADIKPDRLISSSATACLTSESITEYWGKMQDTTPQESEKRRPRQGIRDKAHQPIRRQRPREVSTD